MFNNPGPDSRCISGHVYLSCELFTLPRTTAATLTGTCMDSEMNNLQQLCILVPLETNARDTFYSIHGRPPTRQPSSGHLTFFQAHCHPAFLKLHEAI